MGGCVSYTQTIQFNQQFAMEFQLPSVLQKKLTPYDEVRRKVEAEKKKAVRKASKPFILDYLHWIYWFPMMFCQRITTEKS